MLRQVLLSMSYSDRIRELVRDAPLSRRLVRRFVAGESAEEALRAAVPFTARGHTVSLDLLGEDTLYRDDAVRTRQHYLDLLTRVGDSGLADRAEVMVKLSALGQFLPRGGEQLALEHAHALGTAARAAGTTLTLDMEDHTATDSTLALAAELRADFPDVGVVLQSDLRRTEADCRDLARVPGARVRLCKGAYAEPESVAFRSHPDVDLSFVRCLRTLMAGQGYPMVATHDPRLHEITQVLAMRYGREPGQYEIQLLRGVLPRQRQRLVDNGEAVRVYLPYSAQWYGYFVRRLAERPANMGFFLRSLTQRF